MKKSLVLAMAMALGVTASAYAANPFSDVPAGHWAYDSVNKLVAAGVVDGYPDGTYGGDKLMTRYEMAQIVAKAMAKGADVDKLAAEFADELDTLGVRVANLEKKADNVKVTGEVRYRYSDNDKEIDGGYTNDLRSRIWVTGQVNDDWSYTGMIENIQDFGNDNGDEDTKFQRAYVEGKIGGVNVLAGRYNMFIADGNIYDTRADGVEVSYGEKLKVTGFAGKATDASFYDDLDTDKEYNGSYGDYAGASLSYDMGALKLDGGYISFKDMMTGSAVDGSDTIKETNIDNDIWYLGAAYSFDKNTSLTAMYLKGDKTTAHNSYDDQGYDDDGYVIGLNYKGAKADEVGSWGLWAKYYDQGAQTYVAHTTDADTFDGKGFEGYGIAANYTFAKNIVGTVAWYDTESKTNNRDKTKEDAQIIWADVTFTF